MSAEVVPSACFLAFLRWFFFWPLVSFLVVPSASKSPSVSPGVDVDVDDAATPAAPAARPAPAAPAPMAAAGTPEVVLVVGAEVAEDGVAAVGDVAVAGDVAAAEPAAPLAGAS